jgi:hypothetical protein
MTQLVIRTIPMPDTLVTECDSVFCCPLALFQTVTFDMALIFPKEITFCSYSCCVGCMSACVPQPCEMYVFTNTFFLAWPVRNTRSKWLQCKRVQCVAFP